MRHSCELWTRLGIDCPGGLRPERTKTKKDKPDEKLEDEKLGEGQEAAEFDRLFALPGKRRHERTNVRAHSAFQQAQLAMLLELYRRSLTDAVGRKGTKVTIPDPAQALRNLPPELLKEAIRQGATGPRLALWVAAAAASGAVLTKLGPAAARSISRILPPAGPRPGFAGPAGTGGFGGLHVKAPKFEAIKKRIDRFEQLFGSSGEFGPGGFSGILG